MSVHWVDTIVLLHMNVAIQKVHLDAIDPGTHLLFQQRQHLQLHQHQRIRQQLAHVALYHKLKRRMYLLKFIDTIHRIRTNHPLNITGIANMTDILHRVMWALQGTCRELVLVSLKYSDDFFFIYLLCF